MAPAYCYVTSASLLRKMANGKSKMLEQMGPTLFCPFRGTLVRDAATGKIIHDISDGKPLSIHRGGRAVGAARGLLSTARCQFAGWLEVEKSNFGTENLADVGLIGIKRASHMQKSAPRAPDVGYNYDLSPNLGVVKTGDDGAGCRCGSPVL